MFINVKSNCGFLLVVLNEINNKKESSCVIKWPKVYNIKSCFMIVTSNVLIKIANANILLSACFNFYIMKLKKRLILNNGFKKIK